MPNGNTMSMFINKEFFRIDQLRFALCDVIAESYDQEFTTEERLDRIRDIVNNSLTRDNVIEVR